MVRVSAYHHTANLELLRGRNSRVLTTIVLALPLFHPFSLGDSATVAGGGA